MVSGKRPEHQQKQILDLSILFTIKNVASGYTLCHLENSCVALYVCFRIMTPKSIVSTINWNTEKYTTLNNKGLKRGTKRINMKMTQIFHFTQPSLLVFTSSKSIRKTERHCMKYICPNLTRKAPDQMCEPSFYKCACFLLFYILSRL